MGITHEETSMRKDTSMAWGDCTNRGNGYWFEVRRLAPGSFGNWEGRGAYATRSLAQQAKSEYSWPDYETTEIWQCGTVDVPDEDHDPPFETPRPELRLTMSLAPHGLHSGWSRDWSQIIPGNFIQGRGTDLLFYDATHGVGEFYSMDGYGAIALIQRHESWSRNWSHILPIHVRDTSNTGLLFYSALEGVSEFYATDRSGGLQLMQRHERWHQGWSHIVPFTIPFEIGYVDFLFYDANRGKAELYKSDGYGGLQFLQHPEIGDSQLSHIVPLNYTYSEAHGEPVLLFYYGARGEALFGYVSESGRLDLRPGFRIDGLQATHVIPYAGSGRGFGQGLLFYDAARGKAEMILKKHRQSAMHVGKFEGWRQSWSHIVFIRKDGTPNDASFLFYDASRGEAEIYDFSWN